MWPRTLASCSASAIRDPSTDQGALALKALFLIPGTGDFHCGSCLRDQALLRGLAALGWQVRALPLYLPWVTDTPEHAPPAGPIFFGGISTYLDATLGGSTWLPGIVRRALDHPALLRCAARWSHLTQPGDVGRLSVSMTEHAAQAHGREIRRLARWIERDGRPDVLCLSNSLLLGLGTELARRLDLPLVCSMQGEDAFIEQLPEPWCGRSWAAIRRRLPAVAALVAPSRFYAQHMAEFLGCDPERIAVVPNGIAVDEPPPRAGRAADASVTVGRGPRVGYLARMHPSKGLDRLADAWIELRSQPQWAGADLVVAGARTRADGLYVERIQRQLADAGLGDSVRWQANVTYAEKCEMLQGLTALCVPVTIPEAFGLYVIEAWRAGVPVVVPGVGAMPELCSIGGGWCYDPAERGALARCLAEALSDPAAARALGQRGRAAVLERFTDRHMARGFSRVLDAAVAGGGAPVPAGADDRT